WGKLAELAAMVPISATRGSNVVELANELCRLLPEGPPLYGPDMLTDRTERFLAADLVREPLFLLLKQEMPSATALPVEAGQDRPCGVCDWVGAHFRVVDTGGLDPSAEGILKAMRAQTLRAVEEADVVLFVVDAAEGITTVDEDVARVLRRTGKPVLVAANKV